MKAHCCLLCSYISGIKAEKDLDGLLTPCFSEEIWNNKKQNSLKIEYVCRQPLPQGLPKRPVSFEYGNIIGFHPQIFPKVEWIIILL